MIAAAPPTPLLEARGVTVEIEGTRILDDAALEVARGEVVGLVGPNGAGKSTILRAVTGAVPLITGHVALGGRPLGARAQREVARELAIVQQLPDAPAAMRVAELVLLGRYPHLGLLGRESASDYAAAEEAMARAGCLPFADRELGTLSGGERRRAFIARALAQAPRLLLLDEPTANLDAEAQAEIFELLRDLAAPEQPEDRTAGKGVLVVVHDLTLAAAYCDRLVLLHRGRIVASGPPREVITSANVRAVYGPHVSVVPHPATGAPLVIPAVLDRPT